MDPVIITSIFLVIAGTIPLFFGLVFVSSRLARLRALRRKIADVGLDQALITAASEEAENRGLPGKFVIPLLNTSGQPALSSLQNRALRERMHLTSLSRGSRGGEFDNRETLSNVLRLRAERAQLLGYANHAEYILEDQTAATVAAVGSRD